MTDPVTRLADLLLTLHRRSYSFNVTIKPEDEARDAAGDILDLLKRAGLKAVVAR